MYQPGARKSRLEAIEDIEDIEDIEIFHLVEAGLRVQMTEVPASGLAVDTPEDLTRALNYLGV